MAVKFTKMHGLGNDFVVLNRLKHSFELTKEAIQQMSNRHTGIGFDQLLVIEASNQPDADFFYRIFNADGNEVEQCGNGARCVGKYLQEHGLINRDEIKLLTKAGILEVKLDKDSLVTVNMGVPNFTPSLIPLAVNTQQPEYELRKGDEKIQFGAVSLGNPHAVIFVEDVSRARVDEIGEFMQHQRLFPKQVNVGFLQRLNNTELKLRVFERGAGETLACGSGACAAMAVARQRGLVDDRVKILLPGGELIVSWKSPQQPILLTGPAETSFRGEWLIS